jgi:hypothetical protein
MLGLYSIGCRQLCRRRRKIYILADYRKVHAGNRAVESRVFLRWLAGLTKGLTGRRQRQSLKFFRSR